MEQYIKKSALVAEIERTQKRLNLDDIGGCAVMAWSEGFKNFLDTLKVKEVEETEQRMKECPFRQDVCNRYKGTQVKCDGRCSWVVDYPKLKELKAQKGE